MAGVGRLVDEVMQEGQAHEKVFAKSPAFDDRGELVLQFSEPAHNAGTPEVLEEFGGRRRSALDEELSRDVDVGVDLEGRILDLCARQESDAPGGGEGISAWQAPIGS